MQKFYGNLVTRKIWFSLRNLISFSPFDKENSVTDHVALFTWVARKLRARCEESLAFLLVY